MPRRTHKQLSSKPGKRYGKRNTTKQRCVTNQKIVKRGRAQGILGIVA